MSQKTYKIIAIIACIIAIIGLASYIGGIRAVNPGAFLFPALISAAAFAAYQKK